MKIAVYTCITSNYDSLSKIFPGQNHNIDFICFTDNQNLVYQSGNWSIRNIPDELCNLSSVKQQRIIKACPHRFLREYDLTLWVDGNIDIISDINNFINGYYSDNIDMWSRKHPSRKCIYSEAKEVVRRKKDYIGNITPQIDRYKKEGFPQNYGLHETGIIMRKNNTQISLFGNLWAKEIFDGSHRDQLSFDYCRWKLDFNVGELKISNLMNNKNFRLRNHGC